MRRQRALRRVVLTAVVVVAAFAFAPISGANGPPPGNLPNSPADPDNLSSEQWSLAQIRAFDAHAITGGSPLVRVALIDSGIDPGHPEFAGRIDTANSVSCATGVPIRDPSGALWRDQIGHGTQVAGLIAAGDNGFGIVGVAPHVQLLIVKVANAGQPITPAAAACAFRYVATQQIDVANASFAVDKGATGNADPFDFYCKDVKSEHESIKLVRQAIREARRSGTTVVASAGNNDLDMAHPSLENECIRMPVELPGVIGVSSDGRLGRRAATPPVASNYGLGVIDVTAPGGDPAQGGVPGGLVLSTFPTYISPPPPAMPNIVDGPGATYRYTAGSSFAAAHASGVAALIVSRFGNLGTAENGKLRPGLVEALLQGTAEPKACDPDPRCEGGEGYNGFFGHGEVDALSAVLHEPAP
ncbi:MAG: S8 family peptidase [Gaiellaceae bacterium]